MFKRIVRILEYQPESEGNIAMQHRDITRQQWLTDLTQELREWFGTNGFDMPENIRVSCGFPDKGGLAKKNKTIGQCWNSKNSGDEAFEIFISPTIAESVIVGATLVHEIVHATVGLQAGHGIAFKRCAVAVGLTGKMTATTADDDLTGWLEDVFKRLGEYPMEVLTGGSKTQGTRLLKASCPDCGYTVRLTKKWIAYGLPLCPCNHEEMIEG